MSGAAATHPLDGRQSRSARSRLAICEACLDLVEEGVLQPGADQVADRAGVSRRSVFNHFSDLAELYDAVVEVGMERYAPLLVAVTQEQPIADRVDQWVRARSTFYEATAPVTRALSVQAWLGPMADHASRVSKDAMRRAHLEVERLFGPEIVGLESEERTEVLEALSAALSPLLWEVLRRNRGNSLERARAVVRRTLTSILRDAGVEI